MDVAPFPSGQQVRELLSKLSTAQMHELANVSGVPFTTIYNIRRSEAANPGITTVGKFWAQAVAMSEQARA